MIILNDYSGDKLFTRNELNVIILDEKLKNTNSIRILNLDIDILKQKKLLCTFRNIKEINQNIFNKLANLKHIDFNTNQIKEIHPNLFNGLVNLKEIDFSYNKIEELDLNLSNRLDNLELFALLITKSKKYI